MRIDSGMTVYKTVVPPVKQTAKIKEEDAKVKEPRRDSVTISGKDNAISKSTLEKIQTEQAASFNNMLSSMIGNQIYSNDIMNNAKGILNKAGLGNISPEQAAKNISEDGPYGVKAVASGIMDMVHALSGGDAEKMEVLKEAVTDGFIAAGIELDLGDKVSNLPQVSQDTFTEVMKRFDYYEKNGNLDSYEYTPY